MKSYNVYLDSSAWVCESNLIGCSTIYRYMLENGHKITDNPSKADYIIINSCGLTKNHIDRSITLYKKYNSQKENSTIIMYGCLIKINPELVDSLDVYPIDFNEGKKFDKIFYKTKKFEEIKPYCDDKTKKDLLREKNPFHRTEIFPFLLSSILLLFSKKARVNYQRMINNVTYKNRIFLEISKGCTGNCNYCVIKRARGKICSRTIQDIINDIEKIYNSSKKLFLVANDCGCYGVDIKTNLIELLYEIKKKYPDLSIELNYLNPQWLERDPGNYIKLFRDVKIDFVVIPFQSGSKNVLKNMNRRYDSNKVTKIIDKIKKVSPKTFIYSHFIIGYPGENWIDFFKTLICAFHFDFPIVFEYSEHKGTVSSSLPHHKSYFTVTSRYTLFILFLNFYIFYKLLTTPRDHKY